MLSSAHRDIDAPCICTYITLIFSTLIAGNRVKILIEEQATPHVATSDLLCITKPRPYKIGQNAAATKQTV